MEEGGRGGRPRSWGWLWRTVESRASVDTTPRPPVLSRATCCAPRRVPGIHDAAMAAAAATAGREDRRRRWCGGAGLEIGEVGPGRASGIPVGEADDTKTKGPGSTPSLSGEADVRPVFHTGARPAPSSSHRSLQRGARRCTSTRRAGRFDAGGATPASSSAIGATRRSGAGTAGRTAPARPPGSPTD